ncbi:MAG: cyclic nucleotide-binding domain-containing protein [Gammaproteobacteria bacterium]|nr:cyclic nucleotide-binding domain-containing protein [Gammaproteobacteria bacterium]
MANLIDKTILKTFVPPNALNYENFEELASKTHVEEVPAGRAIFKAGDSDNQSIYLVEGEVELKAANGAVSLIKAGSEQAKHAMSNLQPRKHTATTKSACKITRIDSDLLDILMTWDQMSGIEVDEIVEEETDEDEGGDWMTRILQSKAFMQIPPANIQAIFMRMQEVPVKAGETIIKQGDDGDFYYIINKGKCKVTKPSKTATELTLATLSDGDAFGEEALLSEAKRNANIVMLTDGVLMRLSKEDFNELLKEPMLSWVTREEGDKMVADGSAVWVDVRLDSEFKNNGIEGAQNIPLYMLRMKADKLDPSKTYILYCDTSRRSSAGAFLLTERGISTSCLKGGLSSG